MKSMAEIIKYAQQYQENRPYQIRYRKAKNPDDYFRKHETELILYDGAKEMLRRAKIDPRTLDINKQRTEFSQMEQKKKELRQAYQTAEKEVRQLERERDKLEQYLGTERNNESAQKNMNELLR